MSDTESSGPSPVPFEPFSGSLRDPDVPLLQEHFRDLTQWVIGDAVGDHLTAAQRDALAEEIAVVLASSLAPALRREVEAQAEKAIAGLQKGPVSFNYDHQVQVDGFSAPELVKLIDAVGRLVEAGLGDAIWVLHETHQRALYSAHDSWLARNGRPDTDATA
jgi:hypothetical protein